MSPIYPTALFGKSFTKLSGPENYTTWKKDFKPIAHLNGVWGLYQGTDSVLQKPVVEPPGTAKQDHPPQNYLYIIALYHVQHSEWTDNEKAVRFALALLQYAVEPWVWPENTTNPAIAWQTIRADNEAGAHTRLHRALTQMDKKRNMKLQDFKNIRDYLFQFDNIMQDIKDAGGSYDKSLLINHIIRGLPPSYSPFVMHWSLALRNIGNIGNNYDTTYPEFRSALLGYAEDI